VPSVGVCSANILKSAKPADLPVVSRLPTTESRLGDEARNADREVLRCALLTAAWRTREEAPVSCSPGSGDLDGVVC
jgi:hypothetical protein